MPVICKFRVSSREGDDDEKDDDDDEEEEDDHNDETERLHHVLMFGLGSYRPATSCFYESHNVPLKRSSRDTYVRHQLELLRRLSLA